MPLRAPGLQKVSWNKTVGQQHIWGQYHVNHPNKLYHQSCLRRKNVKTTKRTAKFAVAARRRRLGLAAKPPMQPPSRSLRLRPSRFSSRKHQNHRPRAGFCGRMKNGLRRRVIRRLLMAAKASRRFVSRLIHQIRLQRIFFGFREVKSKPANLSQSHGSLKTNLEGVARTGAENGSAAAFRR